MSKSIKNRKWKILMNTIHFSFDVEEFEKKNSTDEIS